jgi:Glycosyltransferase family 87
MTAATSPSADRWIAASLLSLLVAMLIAATAAALHAPLAVTVIAAVLAVAMLTPWAAKRLPNEWDGIRGRKPVVSTLWAVLVFAALARTAGVALFMADPSHAAVSTYGFDTFYIGHSCYTGYWQAANLALEGVPNLYDVQHYYGKKAGIFGFDEFMYLPQFLLLPLLGVALGADFNELRALWFTVEGGTLLACMIALTVWIGGQPGRRAALLIPAVWIASPVLLTLQLGNFQLTAVSLSVVAMALFWRDRPVLGGALFGFAVFKLFPGVLGIYLIATRRWKAVAWTLGFSLFYSVITYAWIGEEPFRALFQYQLPRMASGEAWAFLELKELGFVTAINDSIPGLVYKLNALDVPVATRALVQQVSWAWTLVVVGLTILSALRAKHMSRLELAANWLALLALASFRSPFLPDHTGLFAPLWVWSLIAAGSVAGGGRTALFALLWVALAAVVPFVGTPLDNGLDRFVVSGISQIIAVTLCLWVVLRKPASNVAGKDPLALPTPFTPKASHA